MQEASPAGSGAVGEEEAELTEEEKLLLQVKELKRQLQVSINSKVRRDGLAWVAARHSTCPLMHASWTCAWCHTQISATKHGQLERHAMEADKERLQGDLRRMQQRIEAQDAALETLQNERKALLHYAQTLEGDAARVRAWCRATCLVPTAHAAACCGGVRYRSARECHVVCDTLRTADTLPTRPTTRSRPFPDEGCGRRERGP